MADPLSFAFSKCNFICFLFFLGFGIDYEKINWFESAKKSSKTYITAKTNKKTVATKLNWKQPWQV